MAVRVAARMTMAEPGTPWAPLEVIRATARMVRRKGQDMLVKAWPAVLSIVPGAVLLLVGADQLTRVQDPGEPASGVQS